MTLQFTDFDIQKIKDTFNCKNYFETGLWDCRSENTCRRAIKADFDKIYSLELLESWITIGNDVLKEYIDSGLVTLINDDSNYLSKYLDKFNFDERTMFFLDAHVDNNNIKNFINKCPLENELASIKNMKRNDNIICIDDLRIISTYCWGEKTLGTDSNRVKLLKEKILDINPDYKFGLLDTGFKEDVLIAYI